jgi:chloramphenicol O-acetyltransferase
MDALAAVPSGHPMIGRLELDVTDALAAIAAARQRGTRGSLFAFVVRAIAVAISEHPDFNLVRHGKRCVRFEDVDVSLPVEVHEGDTIAPREVVVRRAQHLSAPAIFAAVEAARVRHEQTGKLGDEDRWARRTMSAIRWLPRFVRIDLTLVADPTSPPCLPSLMPPSDFRAAERMNT